VRIVRPVCEIRLAAGVEGQPRDARHPARTIHEARDHSHVQQVIVRVPAIVQNQVQILWSLKNNLFLKARPGVLRRWMLNNMPCDTVY
jgi:hypothetical protein